MSYPIIYKPGTTDFDNLGLGLLTDTEKAIVTEELNGQFIFEFTYPVGGALDSAIEEQAFVKVDAGNVLKGQIFEIKKITSDTTYNRSVYAEHISYRLNGIPTKAYTATGNGLQMLTAWKAQLLYGSDLFTVKSDVTTQSTGTFTPQTFGNARTVLGGQEGSILDLVGGQYKFDNFEVSLLNQRGKESHDMLVYGKNITTLTQEENITSTYNAIYPYAQFTDDSDSKKTIVKTLPETIVESKYFDNFNAPVIQVVDFSDKFTGDNAIKSYTDDKLRAFAKQYITNNKVGIPEVSIDLSTVDMNKALGENVESLDLGDTIKVYFQALRINTLAQVSAITWNVLLDQYDSYTIGAKKRTLTQQFINNVASAKETADKALHIAQGAAIASADGKNTDYYGNSINDPFPANPKVGDKYFVKDGDDEYIFMWDGTTWVELVSTKTGEYIANKVDEAIETAKSQAAAMDAVRASEAAEFQSEANTALSSAASERESLAAEADSIASSAAHQLQLATSERTAFSSAATSMANSAASRANSMASSAAAYGKAQAASALSEANSALTTAKSDLTDDISVAKSEAIAAAKDADGLIHKELTETEDSLTQTISQNKSEADGKISTAQTTATQALNGLSAKVSQTDYDQKTGVLDKAVGSAALTADSAALSIKTYQSTADGKLNSQAAAIDVNSKAITTKVSQSDYDKKTKDLDTKYGQVKTTADAVTADVASYKSTNDKKVNANTASINILNNQITSKVSQTDYDKETKDLEGKYSETKQTVDSISNIVTELQAKANAQGQVNQLMNTEFNPDLEGWELTSDGGDTKLPYRSYLSKDINATTVGFDTMNGATSSWSNLSQTVQLASTSTSGTTISLSWSSWAREVANYNGLHILFYDNKDTQVGDEYREWTTRGGGGAENSYAVRKKWENITVPDTATYLVLKFQAREGTGAYLAQPMLVFGSTIGDYVQGNYNNNSRVAKLEVGLNGITGLVTDPKNGLSATATLAANGMTVATNAQSAASTAIQKADGIQTTVESMQAINQFINTEFTPDLEGWTTTSTDGKRNPYKSYLDKNVKAMTVGFYTVGADTSKGNYFAKFQQTVPLTNSSNGYLSLSWQSYLKSMDDGMYGHLWVIFHDKDGNVVYNSGGANKMGNWISNGQATWTRQKMEKVEIPNVATSVDISFEAREGISAYLVRPMIVFDDHIGDVYVAGPYNNNSSMQSIRTQLADQITDEVEDRKTGDKSTVTQLTGVINQKVVDITQGYTSLNTQTSQLFETKIKNVADQVNSMGQVNQLTNTEFMPDLEGWESITEGGTSKAPYRSYWQGNIQATVVGFDTRNAASNTWATFKQNFQLASSPGTGHQISMSWASWASQTNNYNGLYARFFDKSGTKVGESYREWSYTDKPADNAWLQRKKWEGIDVPDTAVSCTVIFQAREGTLAYLGQPMVVLGSTIGSYTPGTYNNNNLVESTRTQLAGMIQDKVDDVGGQIKSLSTQTAGQFTTEIQDRKDGDTNTLTQANKYTVSQIKDAKSGLESEISQSADGIIASVSQVNRLFNTQFSPDLQGWNVNNNGAGGFHYNFYRSYLNNGATVVGVDTTKATVDGTTTTYFSYFEQDVALPGNNGGTYLSMSWDVTTNVMDKYAHLFIQFKDANGATTGSAWTNWNSTIGAGWTHKVWENITIPSDAHHIRVSFQVREGSNLYLVRPMLTFTKTAQPYMPGGYHSTDTVLQLFKDNWAIGIQDNSGKLITGINGDTSNTRIVGKQITLDGNVSVTGDFYALGGNFKNLNASNITVGTLNGANLNIINLDAGSISTGTLNGAKANITNINASNINTGNFNASLITTGQLNAKVLTGDTGHLGTTDTGRIINKQDNHLQLAAKSMYNNSTNRAQLELLANTSDVDDSMKGTLNYYSNPTNSGHGLGIRFKANQILAIDEDGGSKNLYLSPYSGGQVRIVSRDLSTYYDIAAAHFNVSSQRKFKTNITDLEDNALDIVNNTKIHRYTKNGQTEIGVIADETDERLLTDDKKFVSIYDYTSVLYKAVQELSAEIEALKNERSNSQQPSD